MINDNNLYEITPLHIDKSLNDFDLILIENEIYETDHIWYKRNLKHYKSLFSSVIEKVIILKNTKNEIQKNFNEFKFIELFEDNKQQKFKLLFDAKKLNPTNSYKHKNLLVFSYKNNVSKNLRQSLNQFHPTFININGFSKLSFDELFLEIKNHKILYLPYSHELDNNIVDLIKRISIMYNTTIVLDERFKTSFGYCVKSNISNTTGIFLEIFQERTKYLNILNRNRRELFESESNLMNKLSYCDGNLIVSNLETPKISVVIATFRSDSLYDIIKTLNKQKNIIIEVIIITHGFKLIQNEKIFYNRLSKNNIKFFYVSKQKSLGECLNVGIDNSEYDIVCKMDDDDYYSSHYLIDQYHALMYSESDIVGKGSHFMYLEDRNIVIQREIYKEFSYSNIIMGATLFGYKKLFSTFPFNNLNRSEDSNFLSRVHKKGYIIYQSSIFGFCVYRKSDLSKHTWKESSSELVKNSKLIGNGNIKEYVYLIE